MKIAVLGMGYIGLVTAAVLSDKCNKVVGIDIDRSKIDLLNNGKSPIFEPGLDKVLKRNSGRLSFHLDFEALRGSDVAFIAVPTPTKDGRIDLSYVMAASDTINRIDKDVLVIMKSTVVPGTAKKIMDSTELRVISNPEFTREGTALDDTVHPDRIIIGGREQKYCNVVKKIWSFTKAKALVTSNENAELIKYASNSFLATKISFINEFANLCEKIPGADVEVVARGMGMDKRIGPFFLKAGIGFGGSCFPKDTKAIHAFSEDIGENLSVVGAAIKVNEERVNRVVSLIRKSLKSEDISDKTVGIFGLSFKDNTDDLRESQSLNLINKLIELNVKINVYDPLIEKEINGTTKCFSVKECAKKSDIIVVATEWPEFEQISGKSIGNKPVVDAKRILKPDLFKKFTAVGLGDRQKL